MKSKTLRRLIFALMLLNTLVCVTAQEVQSYIPEFHGAFRGRWEMATENGESRFQVRNVRVMMNGKVGPMFSYFFQTDLCDRGVMKILDAYGQAHVTNWLSLRVGQYRMPFGMDMFRAPWNYLFSNRSFVGKQMCNYRAVGGQAMFTAPSVPLTLTAGIFNPTSIGDHEKWLKTYAYASKLVYKYGGLTAVTGFMSIKPEKVRINLWNLAAAYNIDRWTFEGEYLNKHYTHKTFNTTHGWLATASYALPLEKGVFNSLSFQGRYDGMTAHWSGKGDVSDFEPRRQRATIGTTLTYKGPKSVHADLRLDYEKYFYPSSVSYSPTDGGDRLVLELVLCF